MYKIKFEGNYDNMNNTEIKKNTLEYIANNRLLEGVNKVYVATSGGADSMALLNFLVEYKEELNIEVASVHVNHCIRGETADRDENYVKNACDKLGVEFVSFSANREGIEVPEDASEEWARQLRYNFFARLIQPGTVIATAHTLSDQAETVLFRLARGGYGLRAMSGIQAKRDGFIRPMLGLVRQEIESLCEEYLTETFMTDETNLTDDYSRNKIRHHVIPVLKEINKDAESSIEKAVNRMLKAQEYIEKQASIKMKLAETEHKNTYSIEEFYGVDEVVLEEMILQLLDKTGCRSEQFVTVIKNYIDKCEKGTPFEQLAGVLEVSKETNVVVTNRYISIVNEVDVPKGKCVTGMTLNPLGDYSFRVEKVSYDQFKERCTSKFMLCHFADADKLNLDTCVIRGRKLGDTFKPACKHEVQVSKVMKNIPIAHRGFVPMIECNGKIIWVWGAGLTDGFTPTEETKEVYQFIPLA